MAYGVEDPVDGEVQLTRGAFAGAFQAGEDGLKAGRIVVAPEVDDAHGDENLSVHDALGFEVLHHAPGGQLVVIRADQQAGNGLEGLEEAGEIVEAVEGFGLREGDGAGVVAGAELDQRGGQDGAFEVQVQLGLGKTADEGFDCGHGFQFNGRR
jgi:hypothetical protein